MEREWSTRKVLLMALAHVFLFAQNYPGYQKLLHRLWFPRKRSVHDCLGSTVEVCFSVCLSACLLVCLFCIFYIFVSVFCFLFFLCPPSSLFCATIKKERKKIERAFPPSQRNNSDVPELHEITVQCLRTQVGNPCTHTVRLRTRICTQIKTSTHESESIH